ncbi:MAG TPA: peptidylprolyl isomerase [Solirubrobacterales bacterium]|nr:peptidylprolyl isomerase [Solirubrobacterales bacterium]
MLNRIAITAALALACGSLLAACGDGDETATSAATGAEGPCEDVEAPPPKQNADLPPPKADAPTADGVVFDTSCGSFTVTFDDRAPKTAASFQYLAEEGFYDGTVFHRVVPGFVIQGGDPLGSDPQRAGTGGPGYHVDEKPPADLSYTEGLVAMAKSEVEPPGRSGSQFYVVTGADAGLPPDYALVGEVTEGMETVVAIDALGTPGADGPPTQPVVIESATPEG